MKNICSLLFLSIFILSCNTNVTITPSQPNSVNTNTDTKKETLESELAKIKLIKHDELKINKDFSTLHTKEEIEKIKNDFKCDNLYPPPLDFGFGGFEPEKDVLVCSTFDHTENTVLLIYRTSYIAKEADNSYKEYKSLNDLFLPVNTKEEALAFAINSTGYKSVNNTKDMKDLLTRHYLDPQSNYQFLNVNRFQIKEGLKVFNNNVNETFVETDKDGNYLVYLFHYAGNLSERSDTCQPILWQVVIQVGKNGEIKELSKTKILEDGVINDCRGPVA